MNRYTYCHNNPIRYIDPSGYTPEQQFVAVRSDGARWSTFAGGYELNGVIVSTTPEWTSSSSGSSSSTSAGVTVTVTTSTGVQAGTVVNNVTYMADGSRPPDGAIVQFPDGRAYQMNAELGYGTPTTVVPVITPNGNITVGGLAGGYTTTLDGQRPGIGSIVVTPSGAAYQMDASIGYGVSFAGGSLFVATKSTSNVNSAATLSPDSVATDNGAPVVLSYIAEKIGEGFLYKITQHKLLFLTVRTTIDVTYNNKTFSYKYSSVNGHLIVSLDWLVRDFGLDRNLVEHQVGDVFTSIDDVALAWALKYYQEAAKADNNRGLEYASAIYASSGYSFGTPKVALPESRNRVEIPEAPIGFIRVAGIHVHPNISGADNEYFSKTNEYTGLLHGDHLWAQSSQVPLYLATPQGKIKKLTYTDSKRYTEEVILKGLKYKLK